MTAFDDAASAAAGLRSSSPSDRAHAATFLVQNPREVPTRVLMEALQMETVPQIRRLLLQVLETRQGLTKHSEGSPRYEYTGRDPGEGQQASESIDVAALVRHELLPAVGWIRLAADGEIPNFSTSKTNDAIRKLQRRIDGLVTVIKRGEVLNVRRISLTLLLMDNWPDSGSTLDISPIPTLHDIEIDTDEGLFAVLLSNVYQNAIDASTEALGESKVNTKWGYTSESYWIRVTNPFKGDRLALTDVLSAGRSSKRSHQGQGLALIRMAAERLGLAFDLQGSSGIATFSLSGKRPHA